MSKKAKAYLIASIAIICVAVLLGMILWFAH
jgi:hypothetical protein